MYIGYVRGMTDREETQCRSLFRTEEKGRHRTGYYLVRCVNEPHDDDEMHTDDLSAWSTAAEHGRVATAGSSGAAETPTTMEEISRTLRELNLDSGWHAPPHETWVRFPTDTELVASQRVISTVEGAELQVMTYRGNYYTVSENVPLMTAGTQL